MTLFESRIFPGGSCSVLAAISSSPVDNNPTVGGLTIGISVTAPTEASSPISGGERTCPAERTVCPVAMSQPMARIHLLTGIAVCRDSFSSAMTHSSIGTTQVKPSGTGAPVVTYTAIPSFPITTGLLPAKLFSFCISY